MSCTELTPSHHLTARYCTAIIIAVVGTIIMMGIFRMNCLKSICVEFEPGSYVVNYGFMWWTSMPGTSTCTFSWLELTSSTAY